jgi:hypothetical protein
MDLIATLVTAHALPDRQDKRLREWAKPAAALRESGTAVQGLTGNPRVLAKA